MLRGYGEWETKDVFILISCLKLVGKDLTTLQVGPVSGFGVSPAQFSSIKINSDLNPARFVVN